MIAHWGPTWSFGVKTSGTARNLKLSLKPECTVWALHDLLVVVLLLLLSHVTPVWPCGASSRDGETNQLRVGGAAQSRLLFSPWSSGV